MANRRVLIDVAGLHEEIPSSDTAAVGNGVTTSTGNLDIGSAGGGLTFSANLSVNANKNITFASGTGAADFSLGTGVTKTTTGAFTVGASSSTFTNAQTFTGGSTFGTGIQLNASVSISCNAGHTYLDLSLGDGIFKTSTGANTFGGSSNTFLNDITFAAGSNHVVSIATPGSGAGNSLVLVAATGGSSSVGGDTYVRAGAGTGAANGVVYIGDGSTSSVTLATSGITTHILGQSTFADNATPTASDTFFLGDSSHFWSTVYTRRVIGNSTTMLLINQPAATGSAVGCTISAISNMGAGDTLLSLQNNNTASEIFNFSPTAMTVFNPAITTGQTPGITLSNVTAATSANPKSSPGIEFSSNGFNSSSKTMKWMIQGVPSGSSAYGDLVLYRKYDSGAYTEALRIGDTGNANSVNLSSTGGSILNMATYWQLQGSTGTYINSNSAGTNGEGIYYSGSLTYNLTGVGSGHVDFSASVGFSKLPSGKFYPHANNWAKVALVGGTKTVTAANCTSSSGVLVTYQGSGALSNVGTLSVSPGSGSFVINSSNILDTNTVAYLILN